MLCGDTPDAVAAAMTSVVCSLALFALVMTTGRWHVAAAADGGGQRPTFLDKAQECEKKCDGKRAQLPECDLFCIDEACFERVFGRLGVLSSADPDSDIPIATEEMLDDPKKVESFTRCAKLRLLPAVPSQLSSKAELRDEQRRQMATWRARLAEHRAQREKAKLARFAEQKAARAELEESKAAQRERLRQKQQGEGEDSEGEQQRPHQQRQQNDQHQNEQQAGSSNKKPQQQQTEQEETASGNSAAKKASSTAGLKTDL